MQSLPIKKIIICLLFILIAVGIIPAYAKGMKPNWLSNFSPVHSDEGVDSMEAGSLSEVTILFAEDGEPSENFGHTVDIDGDTLAIGTIYDDDHGAGSGSVYIYERIGRGSDQWEFVKKIYGNDTATGDAFGAYLDLDGDTLFVGAYLDNANAENSGSAYVFERNVGGANNWGQVKKIISSDNSYHDRFGWHVKLSGETVVIGAYQNDDACPSDDTCNSGAAYIFERNLGGTDNWGEVKKITANDRARDDNFSWGLDFDNDTIIVGALGDDDNGSGSGSAYVFMRDWGGVNNWGEVTKIIASDGMSGDQFGNSITFVENTLVVGARFSDAMGTNSGAAYVFERDLGDPSIWTEVKKLVGNTTTAGDEFGDRQPAIEGDWVVIGAGKNDLGGINAGEAFVFERNLGGINNWGELAQLTASDADAGDSFGYIVDVQAQEVFVGARFHDGPGGIDQGAVYIYADEILIANDDSGPEFTTDEDTPFTTGNVLDNDTSSLPMSIIAFDSTNTNGLVTNNGDGTFDYDPNGQFEALSAGQQGLDTFQYTISNTASLTDTATVTITILGLNDAPLIENANLSLSPETLDEGETVTLNGTFTDSDSDDAHIVTIDWGDGLTETLSLPIATQVFSQTHTYLDDDPTGTSADPYPILVTVNDDQASDTATAILTVNNLAPELSNLEATSIDEGGVTTLTGTLLDQSPADTFSLTIGWGDGSTADYFYPAGTTAFTETHPYLDDDPSGTPSDVYTVTMTLTDDDNGQTSTIATLTVDNLAPILSNLSVTPTNENGFSTLLFDFVDPGTLDSFVLTLDWGDGTTENIPYPAGSVTILETHQYLDDNPTSTAQDIYTLTLTLSDDDAGIINTQTAIVVTNLPPVADAGSDRTVEAGTAIYFAGFMLDPGAQDTHTIHWDFGDGASAVGTLTPVHTYFTEGTYTVTLTITDDDGGIGTDTLLVDVTETGIVIYRMYMPVMSGCPVWYLNCLP